MSTNPEGGPEPAPKQETRTTKFTNPPVTIPDTPATDRETAMRNLRATTDPEAAAVNEHYRRTGRLPQIVGSTPLPGATPGGIAGTRFTPINRPAGGTRDQNLPPGITINRAAGGVLPTANPRGRGRGRAKDTAPPVGALPRGIKLIQPGPGPQRNLLRYGTRIRRAPSPKAKPALRPGVPPPSHAEVRQRMAMQTAQRPGVVRYPIRYLGILPDIVSEEFDARTGYNPPPVGQRGTEEEEKRWEGVLEGSLRGWISISGIRLKGVKVPTETGEAAVREELGRELKDVQKRERGAAHLAAEEGTDGGRWARLGQTEAGGLEKNFRTHIELNEADDELEEIKRKVVDALVKHGREIKTEEVSLWLSAVTWGNKPSRMVRWAGRMAEIDDGYWLGFYVYKMTEEGMRAEKARSEKFEKEMRAVENRRVASSRR
ncbi:hypothetical protein ACLOAV_006854 [Pseudogymnoascus australis]